MPQWQHVLNKNDILSFKINPFLPFCQKKWNGTAIEEGIGIRHLLIFKNYNMNSIKFNRPRHTRANWFDLIDEVFSPMNRASNTPSRGYSPAVNIKEAEGSFTIELVAPGFKKEDFEIKVEKDQLIIKAKVESEKEATKESNENYKRKEFAFRNFKRSFHLTETLDGENIAANYEAGILSISIPKKEEAIIQPKLITVN